MKSGKRFMPLALFVAFIVSLPAALPIFSDAGALRFYNPSNAEEERTWARQGGQVGLELADPDLSGVIKRVNIPGGTPDDCDACAQAEVVTLNDQRAFYLENVPVVDRNDDGFVNEQDVSVFKTDGSELTVDRARVDGRVDLLAPYTGTVYVRYWGAIMRDTGDTVSVKSRADPTGFTTTLRETRPTSGVFRLVIDTGSQRSRANSSPPRLKVGKNDVITLTYRDADPSSTISRTLNVETTPPVFSNISPPRGHSQRADPEVEFDVTDARSGVADEDSVWVIFAVDRDDDGIIEEAREYRVNGAPRGHVDAIDRGFRVRMGLPRSFDAGSDATIYWWALAMDAAGNLGILNRPRPDDNTYHLCSPSDFPRGKLSGTDVTASGQIGGCMPRAARIDNTGPTIKRAITGRWWDTSKSGGDKTEYDPTKAKDTSVLVIFSEDLDSSTVQNTDFSVDGETPLKAEVFDGRKDYVFLTVPPLAAGATPTVEMVGDARDLAGNYYGAGCTPIQTPTPEPTPDSLDFLIIVLREAASLGVLSDELADTLSDWFIVNMIAPNDGRNRRAGKGTPIRRPAPGHGHRGSARSGGHRGSLRRDGGCTVGLVHREHDSSGYGRNAGPGTKATVFVIIRLDGPLNLKWIQAVHAEFYKVPRVPGDYNETIDSGCRGESSRPSPETATFGV